MSGILTLSEQMLIHGVLNNGEPFKARGNSGLVFVILSSALLCIGSVFLTFGGYLWLSHHYGFDVAALIVGVSILLLSVLIAGASFAVLKYKERQLNIVTDKALEQLQSFLDGSNEELSVLVEENPKIAMIVALIAGFVFGKKAL